MEISAIPLRHILMVVGISFTIKAIYSGVLAWPANLLVDFLKNYTGIDVYDLPEKFTPSVYINNFDCKHLHATSCQPCASKKLKNSKSPGKWHLKYRRKILQQPPDRDKK